MVSEVYQHGKSWRYSLRGPRDGDPINDDENLSIPISLKQPIPDGVETRRLLTHGYRCWSDLYTNRQIRVLDAALSSIKTLEVPQPIKDRLALCVLGAAEMPGKLSRWERFHLKPIECVANHRFSCTPVVVESNLLSPVGRGTLRRRLASASRALAWLSGLDGKHRRVVAKNISTPGARPQNWDVFISTGSSCKQLLGNGKAHVVITDPPYHDDVQYGEMARLFHSWLSVYRPTLIVREDLEAVHNAHREEGSRSFGEAITECLAESHRTLTADGVLLLTFHNREIAAWRALAGALHAAGFEIRALAAVQSENANDHCKKNVAAMLHDLVIECSKRRRVPGAARLVFDPKNVAEKNLAAIGLALSAVIKSGDIDNLDFLFARNLRRMRARKALIS